MSLLTWKCLLPGPCLHFWSTFYLAQDFLLFLCLTSRPLSPLGFPASIVLPPELADVSACHMAPLPQTLTLCPEQSLVIVLLQVFPDSASVCLQPFPWGAPSLCACFLCLQCSFPSSLLHAILVILKGFYHVSSLLIFLDLLWSE